MYSGTLRRTRPASKDGNCSLSDGMRRLASRGRLGAFEIGDARWHDLDTPEAFAHAEVEDLCLCCLNRRCAEAVGPSGRCADWPAASGVFGAARGPVALLEGIASVGWGLLIVLALAGLSHVVRTWAWRLTLLDARRRPSFGRMFAMRLVSEAAGQVGVFGQIFGDTWRVAKLGVELPLEGRITSVALDRALLHPEQHDRDHRGHKFGGFPVTTVREARSLREDLRFRTGGDCVPGGDCR